MAQVMLQQRAEELAQLELEFEDMEIVHKSTEASSSTAAEVRRLQNTVERGAKLVDISELKLKQAADHWQKCQVHVARAQGDLELVKSPEKLWDFQVHGE